MEAKVGAALGALDKGVRSVVLASGAEPRVVARVLAGEALGTSLSPRGIFL